MATYGYRSKIGVISPATGFTVDEEFHIMAPEGVAIGVTRIPLENATPESLARLNDYIEEAAKLIATAEPDIIVLTCTSGSFIKGLGYDKAIIKKIEKTTNIAGLTTSTAVLDALTKMKVKKVAVATPYIDEVNELEKLFLEDNGFDVVSIEGLQLGRTNPRDMPNVEPETMYQLAKKVYRPGCDGVFISCAGLGIISIIESLEKDLGKPVITSNQATFWDALRMTKVQDPIPGYGQLMREQ